MSEIYRLGVDVGGTFTDLLLVEQQSGSTWRAKTPSTPKDQSVGVLNGVTEILSKIPNGANVVLHAVNHGTTIATNAILEQKGAKVALIVTEGFQHVLQLRRSNIPGGLAGWIVWPKPEPFAPLEITIQAPGRIATDGSIVTEFDKKVLVERLQPLIDEKPDAITVSLLNSFANPAHEQAVLEVLAEVLPDTPVSLSSEVLPELMEYERTMTTVANSYVKPQVAMYLNNLQKSLEGKTKNLRILRSDGGLSSVALASKFPVTLALSGPAGGVTGVVSVVANETKFKNLITLDMGGTSTDVALIQNGIPRIRRETEIGDLTVKSPSLDVRTVGAGGGSLASVPDITKALRVGPQSAGAVPGPAAYGKGGTQATVTDANVVLGCLPEYLLGGTFKLDIEASKRAVQKVADDLGIGLYEAAEGIIRIANETMYGALRLVSVEQGFDPRDFSLVAFGGAGPLHANALGKLLGSFPVIVPPSPGVLCAWGDATTLLRHEVTATVIKIVSKTSVEELLAAFDSLIAKAADAMTKEQGVPLDKQVYQYQADLRYAGQAITIPVDVDPSKLKSRAGMDYIKEQFEAAHEQLFTYRIPNDAEIMNLRVVVEEIRPPISVKKLEKATSPTPPKSAAASTTTLVSEGVQHKECPIWDRTQLLFGHEVMGPCVITEMDSNTVILPGYKAEIDHVGNILIYELAKTESAEKVGKAIAEVDRMAVDIIESALRNARNEMDTLMTRASMSPGIREQQDEFNVIAEPSGKMIAGQFGSFISDFIERWTDTVEEGDIFITNDPYSVGGAISHLADWLILMPIHVSGKLIAWTANFGHMTDCGGSTPGSLPCTATSIYQEGIQIPITKLASGGVMNKALLDVIYRNIRIPEWNRADLSALIAACTLAGRRMTELYKRFGDKTYFAAIEELLNRNKKAIQNIIDQVIPESPVYMEDWIDDDGTGVGPWKVACTMSKTKGKLKFDFTGTYPQSASSINFYLSEAMFKMFIGIYLITVFDPGNVANDGFHELVETYIPEGSILKPIRPAALSCRTHLLGRVLDIINGLLGQKAPEFMNAGGFSDSPHFYYSGWRQDGTWFQLYQIAFGGIPGRPIGDGMDGHSLWPGMRSVPVEYLELYFPLRIESYNTVADTGGPGFHRGGNALSCVYRFLETGTISIHDDRWLSKPWGVVGGEPASRSKKILRRYSVDPVNPPVVYLGSKTDNVQVEPNDVLEFITWGGGGWGDPLTREPDLVALEVRRGLISKEGAKRYGVVLTEDLAVDAAATTTFRAELAPKLKKPEGEVFHRGGTIQELAAKALEETGVKPPQHPGTTRMRGPHVNLPYVKVRFF
ncbi:hypothetical protein M427DRAFT_49201 [Gonapodya prolifera JEL478]|uniref:5-oxoprolinase n=1 Tax=Gonapodya prolifera (strain JEL478) TaxID=1344416 RepID=A0A138ZZ04_GONPJ|nr:hypothetical protein M427DRAFT_49201 [Gonapodya prolifera JEL478]|eukprot:KXS09711.1 hypothetical protein M427DRAFT_49201 [Gonapodya prolifera JEL478]